MNPCVTMEKERRQVMTTNEFRESAKIYQFPLRGRRAEAAARDEAKIPPDVRVQRVSANVLGSSWYHEAAIQESKRIWER